MWQTERLNFIEDKHLILSGLNFRSSLTIVAFLFFSTLKTQAQSPAFFHLSMSDGLSDNYVSSLVIDKKGFLWIGTLEGLNVFDGYGVTSYLKKQQPEMASNNVIHLTCDSSNRVWMGTSEGISWIDEKRNFHRVALQDTIKKFASRTILDTKKYGPIIFTSLGQFFFNETKNKWEKLSFIPDQLRYDQFSDAEPFGENQVLYGTRTAVIIFDYATGKIIFEKPLKEIESLCKYSDHEIAIAFRNDGVKIVDINTGQITKTFPLTRELNNQQKTTMLNEIRPAENGSLLVATDHSGLVIIDRSGNVTWLTHDPININSIGSNHTNRVLCSGQGDVILGSTIAGISSFDIYDRRAGYKNMFHDGNGNFYDSFIADIAEDKNGILWMGAFENLIRWDKENDKVKFYKFYAESEGFGYEIRTLCIDSSQRVWAGTLYNGLCLFNEKTGQFKSIPVDTTKGESLKDNNILSLLTAADGTVWAATRTGIFTVNPSTHAIDAYPDHPLLKEFSGKRVDYILQDKKQRIWFATFSAGVYCYDKANNKLIHYSKQNGYPAGRSLTLYQDSKENIHVARVGGYTIISSDGKIRSFDQNNGLKYDVCNGILEDEKGKIWIANTKCIIRFDPEKNIMEVFDQNVGLTAEQFRVGSFYKRRNGELLWGSRRGINYFFSDQLTTKPGQLKVSITQADLNDSINHLTKNDKFSLKHSKNNVLFRFTAINLQGSHNIHYRFMLEGHDENWQEGIDVREARYSLLPAGKYTFKVQASADGINWTAAENTVAINVIPPLWRQWWFITLCALFVISSVILIIRSRNQKLKRKQEELETEQAISYFTSSMSEQQTEEEILWDVAKNCIGRLHFEDCVIYMMDEKRNVFVQKAADGPKSPRQLEYGTSF